MIDIIVNNIDWETRALHDTDVQENMRMLYVEFESCVGYLAVSLYLDAICTSNGNKTFLFTVQFFISL
jgi:hypothetical protein